MSDFQAIATVTEALKGVIESALDRDLSGIDHEVTTKRPKDFDEQTEKARVNIFLYQVTPNTAYRNMDLPTRSANGQNLIQKPVVALDLHYIFSLYGVEKDLIPQHLLGIVARTLHEHPVMTRDDITEALQQHSFPNPPNPSLVDAVELVKFVPESFSLEELSKVWSVFFQTPYALSIAYQGTVVLIESSQEPKPGKPIRERNIQVLPLPKPFIEKIISSKGEEAPIQFDSTILIKGQRLRGDDTRVLLADGWQSPLVAAPKQISLHLPSTTVFDNLLAGNQPVQVLHAVFNGPPPSGFESNVSSFVLRSKVGEVKYNATTKEVTVNVQPQIGASQRVMMFLDEAPAQQSGGAQTGGQQNSATRPRSYIFPAPARSGDSESISVRVENVVDGRYYVRLLIDGAESPLNRDENGNITGPIVDITAVGSPPIVQLRSNNIELSVLQGSDPLTVQGSVTVENQDGVRMTGANVEARWSWTKIERVQTGLVALYRFLEGSGSSILDVSGVGSPLNLQISDTSKIDRLADGGVHFKADGVKAQAPGGATKLFDRLTANNKLTIEAWLDFDDTTPGEGSGSPARIVSYSNDFQNWNFTFGQRGSNFVLRLRTPESGDNGSDPAFVVENVLQSTLTHLTATFDGSTARLYINSVLIDQTLDLSGGFSNWDNSFAFVLANEVLNDRQWKGKLYLVAIYEHDLQQEEISQNFKAGRPLNVLDNGNLVQNITTGSNGIADFSIVKGEGTYHLNVENIVKSDAIFDATGSSELQDHIEAFREASAQQPESGETPPVEEPAPLGKLHVDNIAAFAQQQGGQMRVRAVVHIKDEDDKPAADATVTAQWVLPDPGAVVQEQTETTNDEGIVRFQVENGDGVYKITITNIAKTGYAFDPDAGETEKTHTV